MNVLLQRLQHVLMIAIGLSSVVLAWFWSPVAAVLLLAAEAALLVWGVRRGFFLIPESAPELLSGRALGEAKAMVTHLLMNLTRVQVAYLDREFDSLAAGRAWLKRTLPKMFRKSLDDLHRNLEAARAGEEVPSLRLVRRILERQRDLAGLGQEMDRAHEGLPSHRPAALMIFVLTEHIDQRDGAEPVVQTLAGWNPAEPALIPVVDSIALHGEAEAGVRGQARFEDLQRVLGGRLRAVEPGGRVFAVDPLGEDPVRAGLRLERVPLGFTVGKGEGAGRALPSEAQEGDGGDGGEERDETGNEDEKGKGR